MKVLTVAAAALLPVVAAAGHQVDYTPDYTQYMQHEHEHHVEHDSELVRKAHDALIRYKDYRQALVVDNKGKSFPNIWVQGTPCVSGPDHGAMGIHLVMPSRTKTLKVEYNMPAALIYEPQRDGKLVLVGIEYIHDAKTWVTCEKQPSGFTVKP
jgi:hypothetical protein